MLAKARLWLKMQLEPGAPAAPAAAGAGATAAATATGSSAAALAPTSLAGLVGDALARVQHGVDAAEAALAAAGSRVGLAADSVLILGLTALLVVVVYARSVRSARALVMHRRLQFVQRRRQQLAAPAAAGAPAVAAPGA
jgi:hypothetical protein